MKNLSQPVRGDRLRPAIPNVSLEKFIILSQYVCIFDPRISLEGAIFKREFITELEQVVLYTEGDSLKTKSDDSEC